MADGGRWKVQLELAPAEIAFVYRRGLARGAEVCKRGTEEWRPLVTTPELHDALAQRASLAEMIDVAPPPGSALTLSQTLAISDPSLAALFLARRSQQVLKSAPPPPPPAVSKSTPPPPLPPPLVSKSAPPPPLPTTETLTPVVAERAPLMRTDAAPDWEDTPLSPLRITPLLPPLLPPPRATPGSERVTSVLHARPVELSVVAAIAVVLTLAITALTLRAEAPKLNALYNASSRGTRAPAPRATRPAEPRAATPSTIPVVFWHDLPVEGGRLEAGISNSARAQSAPALMRSAAATNAGPNRASLARALGAAAAAARNCGDGPVSAQVVVTFASSGVARNIHFTSPPPIALRSCVLNALARARLAPFQGEPVTVSKTLRW